MRAIAILTGAAVVQFIAIVICAMFIDTAWPRNVYPYVRYPRWIDWAMFVGMTSCTVTVLVAAVVAVALAIRETR